MLAEENTMRYLKILITSLLISALFSSEMITVSGSIRDAEGNLIEGVNVYTARDGVSTTEMGSFSLRCFPDEIVNITHISYSNITLKAKDVPKNLLMHSHSIRSDEVIVSGGSFEESIKKTSTSLFSNSHQVGSGTCNCDTEACGYWYISI